MGVKYVFDKNNYPKLAITPHDSALAADASLHAYQRWDGAKDPGELLVHFLTDLMHWAQANGVEVDIAMVEARRVYALDCESYEEDKLAVSVVSVTDSGGQRE